jgi:hypothetical protein
MYLAGAGNDPMSVTNIFSGEVSKSVELFSTHEEADTRMLLHAIHADKVFAESGVKGRIIIKSPDTDALVLCVHYLSMLQHTQELWFQTGTVSSTKHRRRYIPVHDICSTLSPVFTNILPAAHAVTGCDTTSSLFGIGKRSVFKVLKENPGNFKDLSNLADCDGDVSVTAARRLVIKLYDSREKIKAKDENLNKLRTRLATVKSACLAKLPPCEATFKQHVLRASLQTYVWMSCHLTKPPPKSPLQFGWEKRYGSLLPVYFQGQMLSEFLQDLICTCKGKTVCSSGCVCFEQGLSCTDLCPCQAGETCRNSNTQMSRNKSIDDDDVDLLVLDVQE